MSPIITPPAEQSVSGGSLTSGSSLVNCDTSQLCSNKSAYFWMLLSVEASGGEKTEQDVNDLVSKAFGCSGGAAEGLANMKDFCQDDRQLQVVEVSCGAKINISRTTCDVLLLLSRAVSTHELRRAAASALQQAGGRIGAGIVGEVERVGRNLCRHVEPSGGGIVRYTSLSSLDDYCQSKNPSSLLCSVLKPNPDPSPQTGNHSCSGGAPRFCDCSAFCNSTSQFYAMRINAQCKNIENNFLQTLLMPNAADEHDPDSECNGYSEILKDYQGIYLECHGTPKGLCSCMVTIEMSAPVNGCCLNKLLQQIIKKKNLGKTEDRLTRMS
ncbi:uncharacterized protein [Brachyistius frenatus]|uniref:uncharacterized protein n=1 Tax=Brachyistius frenatus TaxID=100188 RepID=UPI0037E7B756